MVKKLVVISLLVGGFINLSACDNPPDPADLQRKNIELGKECFQAGGDWVYNGWDGYHCVFKH